MNGTDRDRRKTGKPDDRVCGICRSILRWYPWRGGGAYLHARLSGEFYITGHRPTPAPTYQTDATA